MIEENELLKQESDMSLDDIVPKGYVPMTDREDDVSSESESITSQSSIPASDSRFVS